MGTLRLNLDNEQIKTLYLDKLYSVNEIANELSVHRYTVRARLRLMNIMRNRSECRAACYKRGRKPSNMKATSEQIKALFDKGLPTSQIAKKLGYRNSSNILARLHRMNLLETPYENHPYGEKHYKWQGGVWKDGYIYIYKPDYYRATSRGYVREHILVWEEYHQTKLPEGYLIHHLNGIRNDNRPENLVAMKNGEHVHQTEPFKVRIRELEIENRQLRRALDDAHVLNISEN
jgi:predicted DNA-binding protein YlxM (UPF0122 family)